MRARVLMPLGRAARALLRPFCPRAPMSPRARPFSWEASYPPGLPWDLAFEPKSLPGLLDEAVAAHPNKVCIRFRGRSFRYKEVGHLVEMAARGFRALGVDRGIKVALMLPNCPYTVICFYAVLKAGGTVVNVNPLYARPEVGRILNDSGACILVTLDLPALYGKVEPLLSDDNRLEKIIVCGLVGVLPLREKALYFLLKRREAAAAIREDDAVLSFNRLLESGVSFRPGAVKPAEEVAVLQYTGGTTGFPKAARLTHANLVVNAVQLALWRPPSDAKQEIILGVLPLFHAFGMTAVMNLTLLIGARMVLLPHFKVPEVLKSIDRERPSVFIGVPTMFSAVNGARDLAKYDLSSLKYCISGGAPLPESVQRHFEDLSGCMLAEGYGLSETGPVCSVNPLAGENRQGSVGLPLPGTVVEIVDRDDPDRLLPAGECGEICISGPQVMLGYANRARDNVEAFRGGRLHTGDVGYLDEDGYLYVVDRIKELILSGAFNVYPRVVEEAILMHPAVEEAAVCGIPDDHRGEAVLAFVKLQDGRALTAGELRVFLRDHLAPFEIPRTVEFRNELPRTFIGKISKRDLLTERAARKTHSAPEPPDSPEVPDTPLEPERTP